MKSKRRLTAAVAAMTAVALGVGIWQFTPDITPSAETDELASFQMVVGSLPELDLTDIEIHEITMSVGDAINDGVSTTRAENLVSPYEGVIDVSDRDWTIYDDEYGIWQMSESERAFYYRLEDAGVRYITDSNLDAYYMSSYDCYVTDSIAYNDLGLSSSQALGVAQWFIYNNPQYYFFRPAFLYSDVAIYIGCYPDMADGDDRADITNQMFGIMDEWIESISDDEVTTYQKVLSAHNLLCNEIDYVSGTYDQSIYSTVMQRETVCAGYSGAMSIMLNAVDIPSTVCLSSSHAWNLVQFDDGAYYAVDSTWDDILNSSALFACGKQNISKYDGKGTEHIAIYPWNEWAPELPYSNYSPSYYDIHGEEVTVSAPYGFNHTLNGSKATVTWTSDDAQGYVIKTPTSQITTNKATTTLSNLKAGSSTDISVSAYKTVDGVKYYSDWVTYTVIVPNAESEVKLTAPVVSVTEVSAGKYSAKWNAVANATSYQYDVSSYEDFRSTIGSNSAYKNTSITLQSLTVDKTYYIRVRAVAESNGQTVYSDYGATSFVYKINIPSEPSVSDAPAVPEKPAESASSVKAPTNITVEKKTTSISKFSWSDVSGAKKYEYVVATDAAFKNIIDDDDSMMAHANVSGLKNVSKVYIKVRTVVGTGSKAQYSDWTVAELTIK